MSDTTNEIKRIILYSAYKAYLNQFYQYLSLGYYYPYSY